jgi:hypothetical protein
MKAANASAIRTAKRLDPPMIHQVDRRVNSRMRS